MDWKRAAILFVTLFIVGLMLTRSLDYFFATRAIDRDATLLDSKFRQYFAEFESVMTQLSAWDLATPCDNGRQQQLRQLVYDASYLRWLGVYRDGEMLCQNGVSDRNLQDRQLHRMHEGYSLAVVQLNRDGHVGHEIGLVRHLEGYQYVASFSPLFPGRLISASCDKCLAYRISFEADPQLELGYQGFDSEPLVSSSIQVAAPYYKATFELFGNRDFLGQYYHLSSLVGVVFGLLLGGLSLLFYRQWHNSRNSLDYQIRRAIRRGEIVPYYQPIVDADSQQMVGAEVLMRWQRSDGTLVPPNQFIPFAEASGLVLPMTQAMLDQVVADIAAFGQNHEGLFFSINIVPAHLEDDLLYDELAAIIASGKLGPHRLSLEITERMPLKDLQRAKQVLDRIYALGIDLKLDDAGTGYGCFTYVQSLGVSTLKIDKMFIDTIGQQHNFNRKTLDAIISFARESELMTIAEGVEQSQQLDYLRSQGVNLIQGYLYSKPLDAESFWHWRPA